MRDGGVLGDQRQLPERCREEGKISGNIYEVKAQGGDAVTHFRFRVVRGWPAAFVTG